MLFFFCIIAVLGSIVVMAFGAIVVDRRRQLKVKIGGYEIKIPVGIAVFVAGCVGLLAVAWIYSNGVDAENDRLTTERDDAKKELADTKKERDEKETQRAQAQAAADGQRRRAEELSARLAAETTERKDAQEFARDTWLANDWIALSEDQRRELERYRDGVLSLNKDLKILQIRVAGWPTLSGRKAVAIFEVYRKDFDDGKTRPRGAGLFQFQLKRYTLENESARGMTEELTAGIGKLICDAVHAAIVNGVSPRETFARIPSLARYDGDAQRVQEVAELQYVRMRLQMLVADSLLLLTGYADGEQGPWEEHLDPSFKSAAVHRNTRPNVKPADYALEFEPEPTAVTLGRPSSNYATYGNADLPNLRSEASMRIISDLLKSCSPPTNTPTGKIDVEILDGRVYEGKSEPDRKARVHILIFLKEK
jgi:hypothetical protein